jgi:hypothetical protein
MQVIGNIVGIESQLSLLNDAVNYTLSRVTVTLPDNKLSHFHPFSHFYLEHQKQNNSVSSYIGHAQLRFGWHKCIRLYERISSVWWLPSFADEVLGFSHCLIV